MSLENWRYMGSRSALMSKTFVPRFASSTYDLEEGQSFNLPYFESEK